MGLATQSLCPRSRVSEISKKLKTAQKLKQIKTPCYKQGVLKRISIEVYLTKTFLVKLKFLPLRLRR